MSYEWEYTSCSELRAAAQRVADGAHDAFLFEMTTALERVYRDVPDDPMSTILLPAYRRRCAVVAGHA
jgi:hypothetical protein